MVEKKLVDKEQQGRNKNMLLEKEQKNKGVVVLPYVKSLTERVERIMRKKNISVAMNPHHKLYSGPSQRQR